VTAAPTVKPTERPAGNYGSGVEGLIAAAESRLGCPYVRGAKGPGSFDCSGFVYWCLKQAGVNVSYMTSVRWRTCSRFTRITDINDLQRGDILVFSGSSESTGHVGIYMGGGRMIDAGSSAGCVVIRSSIYTNYWKGHFLMAYRIW
jgi:cell wall-associated NlpC family hydrolase